jgi:hypothetical protein
MNSVSLAIDYPTEKLNRFTTFFRFFVAIPILIVASTVSGSSAAVGDNAQSVIYMAGGTLILGPVLMILFRQKYPRWWFDWNLELERFVTRVSTYMFLMSDKYPSTDEEQNVHLTIEYPDAKTLNRWLPLVKWILAIPHYFVLLFLTIGMFFSVFIAWFAILFTGTYPQSLFNYNEGVMRWYLRVFAYSVIMATDDYPPFFFD